MQIDEVKTIAFRIHRILKENEGMLMYMNFININRFNFKRER
jgi:hypothetical protein